jgi:CheY-like chemotaxis protein
MKDSPRYELLIIEDDEIERLLVRTLLNSRAPDRFQITEVEDLARGLEMLRSGRFDLVLLDHTIPYLSSIQELRLVMAEGKSAPVIIHTGYIDLRVEKEALDMGVHEVLAKGELDPLWRAIERVLDHTSDPVAASPAGGQGKTVLVVEDEPSVRRIMRMSLELADYTVHEAGDGEAALEVIHRLGRQIDLVIADLVMPKAPGDQLARALERLRPGLPVLFVSGASDADLLKRLGRMPGEDEVLWKPFTPEQLVDRVARLLTPVSS